MRQPRSTTAHLAVPRMEIAVHNVQERPRWGLLIPRRWGRHLDLNGLLPGLVFADDVLRNKGQVVQLLHEEDIEVVRITVTLARPACKGKN